MSNKLPEKPETQREQVSMLWDAIRKIMENDIPHLNLKLNITLGGLIFIAIMIAILGIIVVA